MQPFFRKSDITRRDRDSPRFHGGDRRHCLCCFRVSSSLTSFALIPRREARRSLPNSPIFPSRRVSPTSTTPQRPSDPRPRAFSVFLMYVNLLSGTADRLPDNKGKKRHVLRAPGRLEEKPHRIPAGPILGYGWCFGGPMTYAALLTAPPKDRSHVAF